MQQVRQAEIRWDVCPTGFVTAGCGEVAVECVRAHVIRQLRRSPRVSSARHEYSSVVLLGFDQSVDLSVKLDGDKLEISVSKPLTRMRREVAQRYEDGLRRGAPVTRMLPDDLRA
jgi:hypothetical protein